MNENLNLVEILEDCQNGTKLIDLSNQRFGKWTVLHKFDNPNKHDKRTLWTCKCDCGTIRNIESYTLRRGITMCEEWKSWDSFKTWAINNGYNDTLSIDRIDNNKGYYPENCRWADAKMQGQNKRNNVVVEINGESHILSEWCRILGVKRATIKTRIFRQGLTPYEALTIPIIKGNRKKLK